MTLYEQLIIVSTSQVEEHQKSDKNPNLKGPLELILKREGAEEVSVRNCKEKWQIAPYPSASESNIDEVWRLSL